MCFSFACRLFFLAATLWLSQGVVAQGGFIAGKNLPAPELNNLLQGRLYTPHYEGIRGSPYLTKEYLPGDVAYQDQIYNGLPLRYDIAADELVMLIRSKTGLKKIQLTKAYIKSFTLGDRRFINLPYSVYREMGLKNGYYEVAFDDRIVFLAKRHADREERDSRPYFITETDWFLVRNGQAYRIRKKRDIYEAFDDRHKKALVVFLRRQNMRLRKATDAEWLRLAAHLNTLP